MKWNAMRLVAMFLVAAIVPYPVFAGGFGETLGTIGGALTIYSIGKELFKKDPKPTTASAPNSSVQPIEYGRWIAIDRENSQFDGSNGYQLQTITVDMFKGRAAARGIGIAIIGQDLNLTADYQDTVQKTGRYSKESRVRTRYGQWIAADEIYKIVGSADIKYRDRTGAIASGVGVVVDHSKFTAVVSLQVIGMTVHEGVISNSYEGRASVDKTTHLNVSGYDLSSGGATYNDNQGNLEFEAIREAAEKAMDQVLAKMAGGVPSNRYSQAPVNSQQIPAGAIPMYGQNPNLAQPAYQSAPQQPAGNNLAPTSGQPKAKAKPKVVAPSQSTRSSVTDGSVQPPIPPPPTEVASESRPGITGQVNLQFQDKKSLGIAISKTIRAGDTVTFYADENAEKAIANYDVIALVPSKQTAYLYNFDTGPTSIQHTSRIWYVITNR